MAPRPVSVDEKRQRKLQRIRARREHIRQEKRAHLHGLQNSLVRVVDEQQPQRSAAGHDGQFPRRPVLQATADLHEGQSSSRTEHDPEAELPSSRKMKRPLSCGDPVANKRADMIAWLVSTDGSSVSSESPRPNIVGDGARGQSGKPFGASERQPAAKDADAGEAIQVIACSPSGRSAHCLPPCSDDEEADATWREQSGSGGSGMDPDGMRPSSLGGLSKTPKHHAFHTAHPAKDTIIYRGTDPTDPTTASETSLGSPMALSAHMPDDSVSDSDLMERPSTPTPPHGHQMQGGSPSAPSITHFSLLSSSRSSSPASSLLRSQLAGRDDPSPTTSWPGLETDSTLGRFVQAIDARETESGGDFLAAQSDVYQDVLREFFDIECNCSHPSERDEPENVHTIQQRVAELQKSLPPLAEVFGERDSYEPRTHFHQWQAFLSRQPAEPLSFQKTQAGLSQRSMTLTRQWDVDSIWLGATDLAAIQAPNTFRLSFLPPFAHNLSTDQVIQPHGLDLAHTRHIPLGWFNTPSVRFSVFVFFPNSSRNTASMTSAASNALSLKRQRDFYDGIVIPAAFETVQDPIRQEIPRSFDIVYAKSRSFQEKPGMGRWRAEDESRAFQLSYTLPAQDLSMFWRAVVEKANNMRVQTRRGEAAAYFHDPQLLFQAHDLKNTFARPTLEESLSHVGDTVLAYLDHEKLDMRSCWIDIGTRDFVTSAGSRELRRSEPFTLLWKSQCNRRLHERLMSVAPDAPLTATYYRSFLLRDTGNVTSGLRRTKSPSLGHPSTGKTGVVRAKAYGSSKELFSVMFTNYNLFGSGFLPLLALDEPMIRDLASMTQDRQRAYETRLNRTSLLRAWEANKRHLKAISDPQALTNYGLRKEVTFRLDVVLKMWARGCFDPERSPHVGSLTRTMPVHCGADEQHYPFWAVPTRDINALIFTQAARLVLPLDHLFREASLSASDGPTSGNPAEGPIRRILAFYTAQLLCRLLVHSFSSQREVNYDKWVWLSRWRVRTKERSFNERRGLLYKGFLVLSDNTNFSSVQPMFYRGALQLCNPDEASPCADGTPEHNMLRTYKGFACSECTYRTIYLPSMKRHINEECRCRHEAGPRCDKAEDLVRYVFLQTWTTGPNTRYWTISKYGCLDRPVVEGIVEEQESPETSICENYNDGQRLVEGKGRPVPALPEITFEERSPWMNRTEWDETYKHVDRDLLSALTRPPPLTHHFNGRGYLLRQQVVDGKDRNLLSPPQDERRIAAIVSFLDTMLDRCEETVKKTSRNILCWLRSTRPLSSYQKPFTLVQLDSSTKKYRRLLKMAFCMIFRATVCSGRFRGKRAPLSGLPGSVARGACAGNDMASDPCSSAGAVKKDFDEKGQR
ncbi:hypothetical protein HIM_11226 [Hirsutella minnesotensis 3608]|uniref:Uncharacterized protein n=1 Tax=Hirsutella minnesotensis 3608 TaxID=1043627 RepID=A0A0F7ZWQ6_9HYPO|nr:hypothetical protein HIM_11226 [Hirsutella minnesotensis 3608]